MAPPTLPPLDTLRWLPKSKASLVRALQQSRGNPSSFMEGACFATVKTLMDVSGILSRKARFCVPKEATIPQGVRVVVAYLDKNPAELHQPFGFLVIDSLREAWPCKD